MNAAAWRVRGNAVAGVMFTCFWRTLHAEVIVKRVKTIKPVLVAVIALLALRFQAAKAFGNPGSNRRNSDRTFNQRAGIVWMKAPDFFNTRNL